MLDAVVALQKTNGKEIVDFVYNSSHIWSQRHPEKANDLFAEDCIANGWGSEPIKGVQPVVNRLMKMYDTIEDLQFVIKDVHWQGGLDDGTITVYYHLLGQGANAPDGTKFIDSPFKVVGCYIFKVKAKKILVSDIFLDIGSSDERAVNVISMFNKMSSFLM